MFIAACQFHRVDFNAKYHPGVWTPKRDEFTCCGQKSKDAPGCSESTTSSARAHTMKSLQPRELPFSASNQHSRVVPVFVYIYL